MPRIPIAEARGIFYALYEASQHIGPGTVVDHEEFIDLCLLVIESHPEPEVASYMESRLKRFKKRDGEPDYPYPLICDDQCPHYYKGGSDE